MYRVDTILRQDFLSMWWPSGYQALGLFSFNCQRRIDGAALSLTNDVSRRWRLKHDEKQFSPREQRCGTRVNVTLGTGGYGAVIQAPRSSKWCCPPTEHLKYVWEPVQQSWATDACYKKATKTYRIRTDNLNVL